jgi:hypothetical protein
MLCLLKKPSGRAFRGRSPQLMQGLALAAMALYSTTLDSAKAQPHYPWLQGKAPVRSLEQAISPPSGFKRIAAAPGSFGEWLRGLPLKPHGTEVKLYDGRTKCFGSSQPGIFGCEKYHSAVVDIDTGNRDLQQCADAIMRLRAEYLLSRGETGKIAFNYTNGQRVRFSGGGYKQFRAYMDRIFTYAGSYSLEREMNRVALADLRAGDVFIKGGFPGHAVLVVDVAENANTGEKRFLLLQSYMPAQDMHILANPKAAGGGAWYLLDFGTELVTPEWIFASNSLRRFRD